MPLQNKVTQRERLDRQENIAGNAERNCPKSGTSLHGLPEGVLDGIFRCLRIPDLHNLRLSGALEPCVHSCKQIREVFLSRVRDLQHIFSLMGLMNAKETFCKHLPTGWEIRFRDPIRSDRVRIPVQLGRFLVFVKSRARVLQASDPSNATTRPIPDGQFPLSPVDVVEKLECLAISEISPRVARTILREFPEIKEISVMPDILNPGDYNAAPAASGSNRPKISNTVFNLMSEMAQLRVISLENQNLARLPNFFLSSFNGLMELQIGYNRRITKLPSNIGVWLPQLRILGIKGMRISPIPLSLVHVLAENYGHDFDEEGLHVTRQFMPEELLEQELSAVRFPEAAARFSTDAENHDLWWRGTIVHEHND